MTNEYYPFSDVICHHFYDTGGCTFCGYKDQKRSVSDKHMSIDEQLLHFDNFVSSNMDHIVDSGRLVIAPNGSWFTEISQALRLHIYDFVEAEKLSLKYETRATVLDMNTARKELGKCYIDETLLENKVRELRLALEEIQDTHIIALGLEVADSNDLHTLNKGATLKDYVKAAKYVKERNATLCCNVLIAPPRIVDPEYKALFTARYAVEDLGAKELLIMPCVPMKSAPDFELWKNGEWDPINATASSEIFRIIKEKFPEIKIKYQDLRVYAFHGRYGKFFRKNRQWSDQEKTKERGRIREISKMVWQR